jgi:MSHA biogenesis protein MshP
MIRGQRTEDRGQIVARASRGLLSRRGKAATNPLPSVFSHQSSERGFSLISAIFLLVVIAALGTFAVTLSTTQQQSSALDVQGARAYQAARAGIEWGAYQVLRNAGAGFELACNPAGAGGTTTQGVSLAGAATLANFTLTVDCTSTVATEAGATVKMYYLTSTAKQGTVATSDYVERQMSVTIAK